MSTSLHAVLFQSSWDGLQSESDSDSQAGVSNVGSQLAGQQDHAPASEEDDASSYIPAEPSPSQQVWPHTHTSYPLRARQSYTCLLEEIAVLAIAFRTDCVRVSSF